MKSIKYILKGKPLSHGTKKWEAKAIEQLKEQGLPSIPIAKILTLKTKVFFPQLYKEGIGCLTNTGNAELIHNMLIKAGIMKDSTFMTVTNTRQEGEHRFNRGGVEITLIVDEKNVKNKGLLFEDLPLV
jgi:hypothetical protein